MLIHCLVTLLPVKASTILMLTHRVISLTLACNFDEHLQWSS